MFHLVCVLIVASAVGPLSVSSLVAFDCESPQTKIKAIGLLDVDPCLEDDTPYKESSLEGQIVQRKSYMSAPFIACLVEVIDLRYRCGMHSHVSLQAEHVSNYVADISEGDCRRMHQSGEYRPVSGHQISNLKVNSTLSVSLMVHGVIKDDGECVGETWSDAQTKRTYEKAVLTRSYKITLVSGVASYSLGSSGVLLPSGTTCSGHEAKCFDSQLGSVYWSHVNAGKCDPDAFDVLYQGPLSVITPAGPAVTRKAVVARSESLSFAVHITRPVLLCHQAAYDTDHPDLFVVPKSLAGYYFEKSSVSADNMDLVRYINSKFAYLELNVVEKVSEAFRRLQSQTCKVERDHLFSLLSKARTLPDEFAYQYMDNQPGHTAEPAGEVIYIYSCPKVTVDYRQTPGKCFDEMPVSFNGLPYFLTPRSKILSHHGTERICNPAAPAMFRIAGSWYYTDERLQQSLSPAQLGPNRTSDEVWQYGELIKWVDAGIYTYDQMKGYLSNILFPQKKTAIMNHMVGSYIGMNYSMATGSALGLLKTSEYQEIVKRGWTKFIGGLSVFGNAISVVLGLYWAVLIVRYLLSVVLNTTILYQTLGCGWHLVTGIWSSCTRFMMYKTRERGIFGAIYQAPGDDPIAGAPPPPNGNEGDKDLNGRPLYPVLD